MRELSLHILDIAENGITAGADVVPILAAVAIGLLAGALVVYAVVFIDTILKIDDPVGAIAVHLVCGIWGTLAVGLFANAPDGAGVGLLAGGGVTLLKAQCIGILAYGLTTFISAYLIFVVVKILLGLRVSKADEGKGLDISEHGMEAYGGFQIFSTS